MTAYLAADGAALYASTGVNQGRNGTLAFWALEVINADHRQPRPPRRRRSMGKGIIDYPKLMARRRWSRATRGSAAYRASFDSLPMAVLADEILTPGPGQIRALFVMSGNPVITSANSAKPRARARRARAHGERRDRPATRPRITRTTCSPARTSPSGPTCPFTFLQPPGLTPIPWFQYTDRVVPPPGECRDET